MSRKHIFLLGLVTSGVLLIFLTILIIFSNKILFPPWYHPGLTEDCNLDIKTDFPELCNKESNPTPKDNFETFEVESNSGKVSGWFFPSKNLDTAVIFVHGAGGDRREGYKRWEFIKSKGYSYYIYDSPNHGISHTNNVGVTYGAKEQEGFKSVFDLVRQKHKNIFVITNSFGISAVALSMDYWRGGIKGIIMENPPYSLERLVKENPIAMSLPKWFVELILNYVSYKIEFPVQNLNPGEIAKSFPEIPIFVTHGTEDEAVPYKHGEDFFQNLKSLKKEFFKAEGAKHGKVYHTFPEEYKKFANQIFSWGQELNKN
ncbi:MAG: hypothetical protein KDK36_10170 [Leptospiraceae bacterium]|nr:hypothetical protein [Leptospiraceae bacterium]